MDREQEAMSSPTDAPLARGPRAGLASIARACAMQCASRAARCKPGAHAEGARADPSASGDGLPDPQLYTLVPPYRPTRLLAIRYSPFANFPVAFRAFSDCFETAR